MRAELTVQAAETAMNAVIREELSAAWQRGLDSAPHGVSALTDTGAPAGFAAITTAAHDLAAAVARQYLVPAGDVRAEPAAGGDSLVGGDDTTGDTEIVTIGEPDRVVMVIHRESYVFGDGHRVRGGHCLTCRQLIGGQRAVLVTVVSFAHDVCDCGNVEGDTFLMHASHMPVSKPLIHAALRRALHCNQDR